MPASEIFDRNGDLVSEQDGFKTARKNNSKAVIFNPLAHVTPEQLREDVQAFSANGLIKNLGHDELLRAAFVAKEIRLYDQISRSPNPILEHSLPVQISSEEKRALQRERDHAFAERGMWSIFVTVFLAAFLQGFSQSSFNAGSLYPGMFKLPESLVDPLMKSQSSDAWKLGATNAAAFLAAAVLGCPLALPVNHYYGRRGGIAAAAFLLIVTSLASAFVREWWHLVIIRLINGVGMGLKAVSTPVLVSESAVGFWRGTSILGWQLWVACGIAIGFAVNLMLSQIQEDRLAFALIMGAPIVPSLALFLVVVFFCQESPRYLMRASSPNYDPNRAYEILLKLRNTRLQAARDIYLLRKSIEQEELAVKDDSSSHYQSRPTMGQTIAGFFRQYRELFIVLRLRNAMISSSIVALAQQLCGINILTIYSGLLFSRVRQGDDSEMTADDLSEGDQVTAREIGMSLSLGFGVVNFLFCLPAIKTIDTMGRRKWLLITLPMMALLMMCAAVSYNVSDTNVRLGLVVSFLLLFAAAYSPGLGPIPFTVASESFPLSHREAGAAFAIAVNLGFAGLLSIFWPSISKDLGGDKEALGLFSGFNVVAFILVFLFLEETRMQSLEDLDLIFAVPKSKFVRFQVSEYLPWRLGKWFLMRGDPKPSLYVDDNWGSFDDSNSANAGVIPMNSVPQNGVDDRNGAEIAPGGSSVYQEEPGGRRSSEDPEGVYR